MDYLSQVQRAVNFIEANLQNSISFVEVAHAAGFSPFHFQRIFSGLTGESVSSYLRKRRFAAAAQELIRSERRVLDIALDYGFESQASFTRAFKQAYGLTPGEYRRQGQPLILIDKPMLTADRLAHLSRHRREPRFAHRGHRRVVGLHYLGRNDAGEIPLLWRKFYQRLQDVPQPVAPGAAMGVCEPIPLMTSESEVSYLACVEVAGDAPVPEGMIARTLKAQHYAVFTHQGSTDDLGETYQYIFGTYFPRSGRRLADAPDFELYDQRFRPEDPDSEMDIYIPIELPST